MSLLEDLRESLKDHYVVEQELGQGGMAIVYRAQDLRHGRKVALKVLKPELAATVGPERFLREIELTAALQHPHILPIFDSGSGGGHLFYVMPHVEGESLRDRLRREPQLSLPLSLQIAREVADALDYAHAHNVVHRDIKPANILLMGGHAIVADFGIAKAITAASTDTLTQPGLAVGTPEYMSPEQASASPIIDGRSDIYSLACVVFEMLGGEPPFTGRSAQAVLARHRQEPVPSLGTLRPGVPTGVVRALETALAKASADRPASAGDFVTDLERGAAEPSRPVARHARMIRLVVWAVSVLVALGAAYFFTRGPAPHLDRNRVLVFPLREVGPVGLPGGTGESVATYIGHALDRTEPLKWLEGWEALEPAQRDEIGRLSAGEARAVARRLRTGYYIDGSIIGGGDSVTVVLRLYDVKGDSLLRREGASGAARTASLPRLGLLAVSNLLPSLLASGRRVDVAALIDRRPGAIANFLQAEREYRRSQFGAALEHYRAALAEDSMLVLAAIKGAEAANWMEQNGQDLELVSAALGRASLLPSKYGNFARGLRSHFLGQADSAVGYLNQAVAADPSWSEAWMALGEVYFHLMPQAAPLDSLAEDAFERARQLDPEFTPALFHLGQLALRRRALRRAGEFIQRFRELNPDTILSVPLGLVFSCTDAGPTVFTSPGAKAIPASTLTIAGKWLASAVQQWPCARAAFALVLRTDSAALGDRWGALLGLSSMLVASGKAEQVHQLFRAPGAQGLPGSFLYLLDATVDTVLSPQADSAARAKGKDYRRMIAPTLWLLGTWATHRGAREDLRAIKAALDAKVDSTRSRRDSLLARVASAQLRLVEGDSTGAIRELRALRPSGPSADLEWQPWEALAGERLALARCLLARGALEASDSILAGFDSPQPLINTLYLPASLRLRAVVAERLGLPQRAREYRGRLSKLLTSDVVP